MKGANFIKEFLELTRIKFKRLILPASLGALIMILLINFFPETRKNYQEIQQNFRLREFKKDLIEGKIDNIFIEDKKLRISGNAQFPSTCLRSIEDKIFIIKEHNKSYTKEEREERINKQFNNLKEECK